MSTLSICSGCGGFVPASLKACPHCGARAGKKGLGRAARACLKLATGGAMAVTLMACYGGPPQQPPMMAPPPGQCGNGAGNSQGSSAQGGPNCTPGNQQPANTIATGNPTDQAPPSP